MILEILRRAVIGIGHGGIVTFVILTILKMQQIEMSVDEIWLHMSGSLLLGLYFGAASVVFDHEPWSPLKQIVVHFTLSLAVFFPIAIGFGWIPMHTVPIAMGFVIFIMIYALFWFGLRWYFKKLEYAMNNSIK